MATANPTPTSRNFLPLRYTLPVMALGTAASLALGAIQTTSASSVAPTSSSRTVSTTVVPLAEAPRPAQAWAWGGLLRWAPNMQPNKPYYHPQPRLWNCYWQCGPMA